MSTTDLKARAASGRKLLVPYLCAGFPRASSTVDTLLALAEAGADAIELGIPFSDPLADGPVIQAAAAQALAGGMSLAGTLDLAAAFVAKGTGVPLFLMGYANPLLRMGPAFGQRARAAGVEALLVPDLPPEGREILATDLPFVPFAAPNTDAARLEALLVAEAPFLYAVSVLGVTGARTDLADSTRPFLARLKAQVAGRLPVLAGFGVGTPERASALAEVSDGVIVGSALIQALAQAGPDEAPGRAAAFLKPFREALA